MIEIEGPDGVVYEFPAGTPDATIKSAMSRQYPTPAPAAAPSPAYSGSVLPFSRDAAGNVSFDSNAGILGSVKRALSLPGDVATGRVDPYSDQGKDRAMELAGFANPINPAVRAGAQAIPGAALTKTVPSPVRAPTVDDLYAAASGGYERARSMGVDYSAGAVSKAAQSIRSTLEADGILGELAPKSFSILQKLEQPPQGAVAPLSGLEAARRALNNAKRDFTNPTEQLAAQRISEGIDRFVAEPSPGSVVAGPAAEAARTIKEARGNYAAASRSDKLSGIEEGAELRAAAANSGANLDNAVRQRVRAILDNPKQRAGFTDDELGALKSVVMGTATGNTLRRVGNLLGGGGGLGMALTGTIGGAVGGSAGGPAGMAAGILAPLVGMAAKKGGDAITRRGLLAVDEATRMRSPLGQGLLSAAPQQIKRESLRAASPIGLFGLLGNALHGRPLFFEHDPYSL